MTTIFEDIINIGKVAFTAASLSIAPVINKSKRGSLTVTVAPVKADKLSLGSIISNSSLPLI